MRKRLLCCLLAAVALVPNSGCFFLHGLKCCLHRCHCAIAERTYCCDACGEKYHCEWCADPPACCEPCDNCGNYQSGCKNPWVGPKKGCPNCYPCSEGVPHDGCDHGISDF
jgi:hypothetical protein